MNQNIKLKIIVVVVLVLSFAYYKLAPKEEKIDYKTRIIYNDENKKLNSNGKIDINSASLEEFIMVGVTPRIAVKIEEYIEVVGAVKDIDELKRISGIGVKTLEKLSKVLEVTKEKQKKNLNINKASEETLIYYGFSKKEINEILKHRKEKEVIYSNIDMIKIIGKKRYKEYENILNY